MAARYLKMKVIECQHQGRFHFLLVMFFFYFALLYLFFLLFVLFYSFWYFFFGFKYFLFFICSFLVHWCCVFNYLLFGIFCFKGFDVLALAYYTSIIS